MTDAIVAARDPKFYPEHDLPPHRPSTLLLWEVEEPDHVENVAGFIDIKVAALLAHESQYESTMHVPSSAQTESANADVARFRDAVHQRSSAAGALAGISCGEAFKRIDRL